MLHLHIVLLLVQRHIYISVKARAQATTSEAFRDGHPLGRTSDTVDSPTILRRLVAMFAVKRWLTKLKKIRLRARFGSVNIPEALVVFCSLRNVAHIVQINDYTTINSGCARCGFAHVLKTSRYFLLYKKGACKVLNNDRGCARL